MPMIGRRGGLGGGRAHRCCCRRRWRPGTSPCSGWGPSSVPVGSPLSSFAAVGTGEPARLATHRVRGSNHPTGLDAPRAEEIGGTFSKRSICHGSVLRCRHSSQWRRGAAQTLPRCCSIAHGCLIDRFRTWPYQCVHYLQSCHFVQPLLGVKALATMGLIDGEILILAFGVVVKLVIVAAVGATAAMRPRDRVILSKDAITRISRLSAAVMCSTSANCHTSRHRADTLMTWG